MRVSVALCLERFLRDRSSRGSSFTGRKRSDVWRRWAPCGTPGRLLDIFVYFPALVLVHSLFLFDETHSPCSSHGSQRMRFGFGRLSCVLRFSLTIFSMRVLFSVTDQDLTKRCSRRLPAVRSHFFMTKILQEIFSLAPGSRG